MEQLLIKFRKEGRNGEGVKHIEDELNRISGLEAA